MLLIPILTFGVYDYPYDSVTRDLKQIETDNFIIIYSDKSLPQAVMIADIAEAELAELEKSYGKFELPAHIYNQKIRVIVTSDVHIANGFASGFIYPTIHMYANKPPHSGDSHSLTGDGYLRTLFRHELTHIVNIAMRHYFSDRFINFLNGIVVPSAIFSTRSFLEGSAMARESDDGFGRLNDPYTYHLMRRDMLDGKFPTFAQFSGAHTKQPTYPYTYGALFNKFLYKNYIENEDREYWDQVGRWRFASQAINLLTKGKPQKEIWEDFKKSLEANLEYEENPDRILKNYERYINSIQYVNGKIYYFNLYNKQFRSYNIETRRNDLVVFGNSSWYKVSISQDEKTLLISGYSDKKIYTILLKNKTLLELSKPYFGVGDASFIFGSDRDFSAISYNKPYPELIEVSNGELKVLYKGSENNYFDTPLSIDGKYIYFIHDAKDKRYISRIDRETLQVSRIDNTNLKNIRALTAQPGGVSVSYAGGTNEFFKRALIDVVDEGTITFVTNNIKGEIFESAVVDNTLYYRSGFHAQDNILRLPLKDKNYPQEKVQFVDIITEEPPPIIMPPSVPYKISRDFISFSMLPYADIFKAGLQFIFQDSLGANFISLGVNAEYIYGTPEFYFRWTNEESPVKFLACIYNFYVSSGDIVVLPKRHMLVEASFGIEYTKNYIGNTFSVSVGVNWAGRMIGRSEDYTNTFPYLWNDLVAQQVIGDLGFVYNNFTSEGNYGFYRCILIALQFKTDFLNTQYYQVGSKIQFSPPYLPITFSIYNVYDSSYLTTIGTSVLGTSFIPRYEEYSVYYDYAKYVFFAEAQLMAYSWEIQQGIFFGELFFNRWSFFTGYRAARYTKFLNSIFISTEIQLSLLYGNVPLSLTIEGNYIFNINRLGYNFIFSSALPI